MQVGNNGDSAGFTAILHVDVCLQVSKNALTKSVDVFFVFFEIHDG